jgi:hypothetical protein
MLTVAELDLISLMRTAPDGPGKPTFGFLMPIIDRLLEELDDDSPTRKCHGCTYCDASGDAWKYDEECDGSGLIKINSEGNCANCGRIPLKIGDNMSEGNRPTTRTKNKKLPQRSTMPIYDAAPRFITESTNEKIEALAKDLIVAQVKPGYPATTEMAQQAVKTAKAFYAALEKPKQCDAYDSGVIVDDTIGGK